MTVTFALAPARGPVTARLTVAGHWYSAAHDLQSDAATRARALIGLCPPVRDHPGPLGSPPHLARQRSYAVTGPIL